MVVCFCPSSTSCISKFEVKKYRRKSRKSRIGNENQYGYHFIQVICVLGRDFAKSTTLDLNSKGELGIRLKWWCQSSQLIN